MKVKSLGTAVRSPGGGFPVSCRSDAADLRQPFERHLCASSQELYEEHIAHLALQVDEQGRILTQKADIFEMERYRELISDLLTEIVGNAYVLRREKTIDSRGRLKIFATVSKINAKLEEIAREILTGNRDSLEILSRIDDIRGLLIDILT